MNYFDDVFISFLDKDSIPYIHFQCRDRKRTGLEQHEGESM